MWEWFGRGMGFPPQKKKKSRHFQLKDENKQGKC